MVYINIASIPDRLDCLTETIESLYNQCDEINIVLNNYKSKPFNDKKINQVILDNSKGDAGKTFFLNRFSGWAFLCDDDLIYPKNYVDNTLKNIYLNDLVTYHGRTIDEKFVSNYYKAKATKYRCLDDVFDDVHVQIGGTGVMAFHTNDFKIDFNKIRNKNMLDLVISSEAKKQHKKITCLKHGRDWIKYNPKMLERETIYDRHVNNCDEQTKFFNFNFV
jgi:hypothetical protein